MTMPRPIWSRCVIGAHLLVVIAASFALALTHSDWARVVLSFISGTSIFVLTGLVHEARSSPASAAGVAQRPAGQHGRHIACDAGFGLSVQLHLEAPPSATNRDDDPNKILKSVRLDDPVRRADLHRAGTPLRLAKSARAGALSVPRRGSGHGGADRRDLYPPSPDPRNGRCLAP